VAFHALQARPLVGKGPLAKVQSLTTLGSSAFAAARLVRRLGVHVVLGTGGYASAPAVAGARLAGRPILLLEPNARAGMANRWLSGWANGAVLGWREAEADLKCPTWVTGVPVRAAFFAVPAELPPAEPLHLLVLGGSQGAQQINHALPEAARRLAGRLPGLRILHQAGARNLESAQQAWAASGFPADRVEVVPFLDDVAGAMGRSHLLVSRAGAITLAEICAAGRASLLVPLSIAQGHQVDNARALADAGAAEMIESSALTPELLADRLAALLTGLPRLSQMGQAARGLANPRAVAAIADHLEELGGIR
jgi:UDP-N-acetylglucosamine--N-acetylmuramyl-(pentapeptide) pyrophosphoryl-undecaprenol N-acetylglucosamine transferase